MSSSDDEEFVRKPVKALPSCWAEERFGVLAVPEQCFKEPTLLTHEGFVDLQVHAFKQRKCEAEFLSVVGNGNYSAWPQVSCSPLV